MILFELYSDNQTEQPRKFCQSKYKFGVAIGLGLIGENPDVKAVQLMEVSLEKRYDCDWIDSTGIVGTWISFSSSSKFLMV